MDSFGNYPRDRPFDPFSVMLFKGLQVVAFLFFIALLVINPEAKQGKIDTNLLNQMSSLVSAQGFSLTNKVWQVCNGWLMDAKRKDGSVALLYVDPKTQTLVDVNFNK